jgi:hypothetical protein
MQVSRQEGAKWLGIEVGASDLLKIYVRSGLLVYFLFCGALLESKLFFKWPILQCTIWGSSICCLLYNKNIFRWNLSHIWCCFRSEISSLRFVALRKKPEVKKLGQQPYKCKSWRILCLLLYSCWCIVSYKTLLKITTFIPESMNRLLKGSPAKPRLSIVVSIRRYLGKDQNLALDYPYFYWAK